MQSLQSYGEASDEDRSVRLLSAERQNFAAREQKQETPSLISDWPLEVESRSLLSV
jgi:hypothetical protein